MFQPPGCYVDSCLVFVAEIPKMKVLPVDYNLTTPQSGSFMEGNSAIFRRSFLAGYIGTILSSSNDSEIGAPIIETIPIAVIPLSLIPKIQTKKETVQIEALLTPAIPDVVDNIPILGEVPTPNGHCPVVISIINQG